MKLKRCPTCSRIFGDENLRYCLDDGATLVDVSEFTDSPETLRIPGPRSTRPARTEVLHDSDADARRSPRDPHPPARKKLRLMLILGICLPILFVLIATVVWAKTFGGNELLYQTRYNNPTRMKLLIFLGADVNAKDEEGCTALMGASWRGYDEAVKLLLDSGADVSVRNMRSETALILASKARDTNIVRLLVDKSAEVNARDDNGWSSLMWAAWEGRIDTALVLLNRGANQKLRNNRGEAATDLAYKRSFPEIVQILE